jgi:hypothetical protein
MSLPARVGDGCSSLAKMRSKEMFLGNRARPARKADNLTAICEPIV